VKISLIAFLFVLVYPFTTICSQDLDFYREDINFELSKDYFKVDGYYYFRNLKFDPITSNLFYPFPNDSIYGIIDSVFAFDIIQNRDNLKQVTQKAAGIELFIQAFDTTVINIGYRQELKSNKAEYILTTTKGWGKAFEEVHYKLVLDTSILITSFSLEPETSYFSDKGNIFLWNKENFLPAIDFIVNFDVK